MTGLMTARPLVESGMVLETALCKMRSLRHVREQLGLQLGLLQAVAACFHSQSPVYSSCSETFRLSTSTLA